MNESRVTHEAMFYGGPIDGDVRQVQALLERGRELNNLGVREPELILNVLTMDPVYAQPTASEEDAETLDLTVEEEPPTVQTTTHSYARMRTPSVIMPDTWRWRYVYIPQGRTKPAVDDPHAIRIPPSPGPDPRSTSW